MKTFNELALVIFAAGTLFTACRKDSPMANDNNPAANPSSTSISSSNSLVNSPDSRAGLPSSLTVMLGAASSSTTTNPGDWQGGNVNPQDPLIPQHIYISLQGVQIRRKGSSDWEVLNPRVGVYDLVALMQGSTGIAGQTLHSESITDVRFVVDKNSCYIVTGKGMKNRLYMPKHGNTIDIPFQRVIPDVPGGYYITIDFILDQCIQYEDNTYTLLPVVKQ